MMGVMGVKMGVKQVFYIRLPTYFTARQALTTSARGRERHPGGPPTLLLHGQAQAQQAWEAILVVPGKGTDPQFDGTPRPHDNHTNAQRLLDSLTNRCHGGTGLAPYLPSSHKGLSLHQTCAEFNKARTKSPNTDSKEPR